MKLLLDHLPDGLKLALDGLSISALLGSLTAVLPHIASLLTVIWTAMRIYESVLALRQLKSKEADTCSKK